MKTRQADAGIYSIINLLNGRQYVGQTSNFRARWKLHKRLLNRGAHHCEHLQHAWDKYGSESFIFTVLEVVEDLSQLTVREQAWFDTTPQRYNTAPIAGTPLGIKLTAETRALQSRAAKAQWQKPNERERRSLAMRGSRVVTPEERMRMGLQRRGRVLKLSDAQRTIKSLRMQAHWLKSDVRARQSLMRLGRPLTPAHRAKVADFNRQKAQSPDFRAKLLAAWERRRLKKSVRSAGDVATSHAAHLPNAPKRTMLAATRIKLLNANLGRKRGPQTPEHRAKIAAALRGRVVSEATRAKQSAARKGQILSTEHREKYRIAATGRTHTPETRQKISEANRQRVWNPESRAKISELKRNQKRSPEAIAKQRASIKAFYERKRAEEGGE